VAQHRKEEESMNSNFAPSSSVRPIEAIHPGEHLAEELEEMGMSAAEFSRQIGVPTNRVTQIMNGLRSITGDTALRLGHFFGGSAEFWLNLQSQYELRLAEKKFGKAIRSLPTIKTYLRSSQVA
jgi:addiction module HigA family antidote